MTPPPLTSAEIPDEWIASCKEAMNQREGVPIRAHPTLPRIQAWSINYRQWADLMLFGSGYDFVNAKERDLVVGRLGRK